jgi:hypothetical protein
MSRIVRNLIVIFLGAASSLIVASVLFWLALRGGRSLFSITVASWVPAGAIGAGVVAAAGYYAGSRLLRLRPARIMLAAILLFSAGTVYLMDSVDFGLMRINRKSIHGVGSMGGFVSEALAQSPLRMAFAGGGSGDAASSTGAAPSSGAAAAAVAGDSNSSVAGIGGGVQGMLNTGNALSADNMGDAMSGAKQRLQGVQAFGSTMLSHGWWLWTATLQFVGFALAGLVAFIALRNISYCDECMVFLSKKGAQTRYFNREREIQGSVDEFLSRAKARRFRQSIEAHAGFGSKEKAKTSEYSSTVDISLCPGCHKHRLRFSARCKKGITWKDITMLGYEAFCLEPIDVMRNANPVRIR